MAGEFLNAPRDDQIAFLKSKPEFAGTSDTDLHDFINQYTAKNADIKTGQGMEQAAQQQATQSLANRPMAQRDILGRDVPETTSAARGESGVGAGPALAGWTMGAGGIGAAGATVPKLVRMGIGGVTGYTGSEIGERAGGRIGRMADEALAGFRGMPAQGNGQWERIGRIGGGLAGGLIGGGLGYKYGLPESIEQKLPFTLQSPQARGRAIEMELDKMYNTKAKAIMDRGVQEERLARQTAKAATPATPVPFAGTTAPARQAAIPRVSAPPVEEFAPRQAASRAEETGESVAGGKWSPTPAEQQAKQLLNKPVITPEDDRAGIRLMGRERWQRMKGEGLIERRARIGGEVSAGRPARPR
jgi:hypothetical protein